MLRQVQPRQSSSLGTSRRSEARGLVTTTVALLMLLVVSVLVFYVNKGIWLEQRTSINQYQAKQAFNAAEAGLEYVLSVLNATTGSPRRSTYLTASSAQPGTFSIATATVTGTPGADLAFSVVISLVSGDSAPADRFVLTATGGSDCTTAGTLNTCRGRAVVSQIVELTPVLLSPPDDATSVYGATGINGNAARLRNAEGVGYPLRTGSTLSFSGGSGSSVLVSSLTAGSCTGSNKAMCNGFTSLASSSAFFSSFFGATLGDVQAMTTAVTSDAGFSASTSGLVWHQGDLNLRSDLGTTTNPVLLVVNGNLTFNGNRDIVGFVYVTGNLTISGASSILGAVAAAGNATVQGNVDIEKNSTVLNQLKASASSFNKVPGTWRDWSP
jgi:hypothetical protein